MQTFCEWLCVRDVEFVKLFLAEATNSANFTKAASWFDDTTGLLGKFLRLAQTGVLAGSLGPHLPNTTDSNIDNNQSYGKYVWNTLVNKLGTPENKLAQHIHDIEDVEPDRKLRHSRRNIEAGSLMVRQPPPYGPVDKSKAIDAYRKRFAAERSQKPKQ